MKSIYGLILFVWLAIEYIISLNNSLISIAFLLGMLCLFIVKEKFFDNLYGSALLFIATILVAYHNASVLLLLGISILDCFYLRKIYLGFGLLTVAVFVVIEGGQLYYSLPLLLAALFGFLIGQKEKNEKQHTEILDEERRLRYRLEATQNELIQSRKEIEHLTEIRERNRIAHEIHDTVGHSIAGVLFQIEGAKRILHKDKDKVEEILSLCSKKLSEALELTRNTVHNMKADKKIGIELFENIIREFTFCPTTFEHSGDFATVPAYHLKIIEVILKESLTNASKYSNAQNIQIKIDIKKSLIRYYYKDDGVGCEKVIESLGISGMRQRVRNAGGTIAIDGEHGFLIVVTLPVRDEMKQGERLDEDTYSG